MKVMLRGLLGGFLAATSVHAQDAQLTIVFEQPMGGVYFQEWMALELGTFDGSLVDVYVLGEGKMGEFAGVLGVHCTEAVYSKWKATGGYLTESRVPVPAINAIRAMVCP